LPRRRSLNVMKPALVLVAAILFVSAAAAPPLVAQDPQNVVGGLRAQQEESARRGGGPARPAPRNAAGRVLLQGATPTDKQPGEKGVWLPGPGITGPPIKPIDQLPIQPWARAVFADRQVNELEPHTRCKPSGVAREFQTPYGVEFVELPEQQKIYIFDIGGPHTFRTIYMDGRSHPTNGLRTAYGHSTGWWEGDTLVSDTTNFHEGFWLDRKGLPHTEQLHTIERWTRKDYSTMEYSLTVDDPGAYTARWTTSMVLTWEPNTELFEYVCQQQNYAHELMVGEMKSVDRTTVVVP
jgi:hypothetical protein